MKNLLFTFFLFSSLTSMATDEIEVEMVADTAVISSQIHTIGVEHDDNFASDSIKVTNLGSEALKNIVIIVNYSHTAEFMQSFKQASLVAERKTLLKGESIVFRNAFYSEVPFFTLKGNKLFIRIISDEGETKLGLENSATEAYQWEKISYDTYFDFNGNY